MGVETQFPPLFPSPSLSANNPLVQSERIAGKRGCNWVSPPRFFFLLFFFPSVQRRDKVRTALRSRVRPLSPPPFPSSFFPLLKKKQSRTRRKRILPVSASLLLPFPPPPCAPDTTLRVDGPVYFGTCIRPMFSQFPLFSPLIHIQYDCANARMGVSTRGVVFPSPRMTEMAALKRNTFPFPPSFLSSFPTYYRFYDDVAPPDFTSNSRPDHFLKPLLPARFWSL